MLVSLCADTNHKIRFDGALFFKEYLLANYSELVKNDSDRLKQTYLPEVIELVNDEELSIKIEALECLVIALETMKTEEVEQEVMPSVLKLFEQIEYDEITIKVSAFFGQLVYKLSLIGELHMKYRHEILKYYKQLCTYKEPLTRQHASYCLPCLNLLYGFAVSRCHSALKGSEIERTISGLTESTTAFEDEELKELLDTQQSESSDFDAHQIYLQFTKDEDEKTRQITALHIHQAF